MGRLTGALDQLEASAMRRSAADAARANLEDELAVMADDRTRLAAELDGALARAQTLGSANAEVAQRLDRAGATVRAILAGIGRPSGSSEPT